MEILLKPSLKKPDSKLHLLPCGICHDGPAKVSTYFSAATAVKDEDRITSTFRGRKLKGKVVILPENYVGMVYKESSVNEAERLGNEKETEHRFWTSSYTFDQFTVWEHDTHPSDEDMYVRLNQWLQLSNVLHE